MRKKLPNGDSIDPKPTNGKPKKPSRLYGEEWRSDKIGRVLLDLSDALRKAERCRRLLAGYGLSQRRWQEIVKDVDPHLRFMARPQLRDEIVTYLESLPEPVKIDHLVNDLHVRGVDTEERIRQVIRVNVQSGRLELHPEKKIALPRRKVRIR